MDLFAMLASSAIAACSMQSTGVFMAQCAAAHAIGILRNAACDRRFAAIPTFLSSQDAHPRNATVIKDFACIIRDWSSE
jgi:hypothetical protein